MSDSVSLTCPNCAGRLQIPPEVERFACMYCGTELNVKRGGGIVLLNPVMPGQTQIPPESEQPVTEPPPIPVPPVSTTPVTVPPVSTTPSSDRAAAERAIRQLEPEIAALSQQINDLSAQMQQALADLAADEQAQSARRATALPPVSAEAPLYVRWFQRRAWWKSLVGGVTILTLLACLFFCLVAVADPGQTVSTSDPATGETVVEEESFSTPGTVMLCCCCLVYPLAMLLLFLGVLAAWNYTRKATGETLPPQGQAQPFAAEREALRAALVRDFQARRAPLEAELAKKKQQLADHRRVVED